MLRRRSCLCLVTALFVHVSTSTLLSQKKVNLDKSELIEVENLSESLANALLDFSVAVRQRDLKTVGTFFADEVEALTFPLSPLPAGESIKWIRHSSVDLSDSQPGPTKREQLIEEWTAFFNRFSEVEDARFQLKGANFKEEAGGNIADSQIEFFLIGRDHVGKRLWVKGTGRLNARQKGEAGWEISLLIFERIDTLTAQVDLFSEVSLPAGVSISLPSYGSPGNDDFVYHGATAGDINGDGFIDVVATGLSSNYMYLNQGDGTFKEVAWDLGLPPTPHATAPLLIDFDNDGDLDIFLAAVGDQMLFENRLIPEGKLFFIDVSLLAGVALPAIGFSATAGDANADGWADIYVTSHNHYGRIMPNSWHQATNGTANLLFINQKNGSFKESGQAWGVRDMRWSYAAQFADLNNDGRQDLYVANDFAGNAFYINLGDRFEDRATASGVLDPGNGMGVSFGDYNNDGHLDIYVTNMSSTAGNRILSRLFPDANAENNVLRKLAAGNSLFKGKSDGSFIDVTEQAGPFVAGWAWGGVFIDFDNDGWEDLYSPSGFISGKSMKDT